MKKTKRWKHQKNLTLSISCALALGISSSLYGVCQAAEVGEAVTVEANTIKETTAKPSGNIENDSFMPTYQMVEIKENGRWRPMDAIGTKNMYGTYNGVIVMDKLNVASGGIVDLAWQEIPVWAKLSPDRINENWFRNMNAKDVTLADQSVFRFDARMGTTTESCCCNTVELGDWESRVKGSGKVYVQLGNITNFNPVKLNQASPRNGIASLIHIYESKVGQFKVEAQESFLDGPLNVYKVLPVIEVNETRNESYDPETGKFILSDINPILDVNLLDYKFDQTKLLSESAKTASDMQLAMRNLWRIENTNAFGHLDELHASKNINPEGIWTNVYRGKFTNGSCYGRSVRESYYGQQIGYDKVRPGDFYAGKLYTGIFFQQTKADSGLERGSGNSKSQGFGTYATWQGKNGHYLDLVVRGSKINNDYYLYSNDSKVMGSNDAWAFGVNTRYGIYQPLSKGWYWEPQVGFAVGKIDEAGYTTSNGLDIEQSQVNVTTGQVGVLLGRNLPQNKGNLYGKVAIYHDFAGNGSILGKYSYGTQAIDTGANRDTWCALSLGGKAQISPTGNFDLQLLHTFGGDVKNTWQVNGGLSWNWRGFCSGTKKESAVVQSVNDTVPVKEPVIGNKISSKAAKEQSNKQENTFSNLGAVEKNKKTTVEIAASEEVKKQAGESKIPQREKQNVEPAAVAKDGNKQEDLLTFPMEAVLVEAKRPDWEEKLSPGTVTVIEPNKYKGEQKTLPELLKEVPGVHIRYINGIGQYTTVSVRGSTASQVGVFVDGVLTNLGGDAAVDLSTIPVKNIERIEVYRGYVPARFGGTYMGGVINIVTKKPEKTDISASYGQRSWGGKTGSLQVDAPLGKGTLLVGLNRDQSDGDFRYTNTYFAQDMPEKIRQAKESVTHCEEAIAEGQMSSDNPWYLYSKKYLNYLESISPTRYRMNNNYKNTDALIKWQDDHWMVKTSWKEVNRVMVNKIWGAAYDDVPWADIVFPIEHKSSHKYNPRREQKLVAKDFLVGRRDTTGNLEWGWSVNYLDQNKRYNNPDIGENSSAALRPLSVWNTYDTKRLGASLDGTFKAGNHLLDFLLSSSKETMKIDGWKMDKLPETSSHQWKNDYKQALVNIQLQDTITLNDKEDLWFTPSIRYNSSDILGKSRCIDDMHRWTKVNEGEKTGKTTWQLALKKKVDEHLTLRSAYGSYYRLLNLYEIAGDGASIIPRPNTNQRPADGSVYPRPEEGMQWDVGANWQGNIGKAKTDTSITYFKRHSDNLLQLLRYGLDFMCYDNSVKGRVEGVELQTKFNWAKWDFDLAATHLNTSRSAMYKNVDIDPKWENSQMIYTPEWEGRIRLTYRPNIKTALFTEVNYTGKQNYEDAQDTKATYTVTPLTTIGVGGRYKFDKNAQVVFGVNDLLNKGPKIKKRHYEDYGIGITSTETMADYPLQGRTYYATVQCEI